jgi:hypothetical protein
MAVARPVATTTPGAAGGHAGAQERQVGLVAAGQVGIVGEGLGGLGHRRGLPGERRLVHLQRLHLGQAQIRRDHAALLQLHHVAGNQRGAVDLARLAAADHQRAGGDHGGERLHRRLGPIFLQEAHGAVGQQHRGDDDGVGVAGDGQGHHQRAEQDVDQRAGELVQEHLPGADLLALADAVGAVLGEALLGIGVGEAVGAGAEVLADAVDAGGIPVHGAPPGVHPTTRAAPGTRKHAPAARPARSAVSGGSRSAIGRDRA